MIDTDYIRTMARYSAWQNANVMESADALEDSARQAERGAFFGSIQATLNHLLWGDRIWMHRFAETGMPRTASIRESIGETDNWSDYCLARTAMDLVVTDWAARLEPIWLDGELTWFSTAANRSICKPKQALVVHLFNHGTHHRSSRTGARAVRRATRAKRARRALAHRRRCRLSAERAARAPCH